MYENHTSMMVNVNVQSRVIPCLDMKDGRRTAVLEHAVQQVRDWRRWLTDNIDYARRPRDRSGLGLEDIHPRTVAYVIIGRRQYFSDEFNALRQQIFRDEFIHIKSWDGV